MKRSPKYVGLDVHRATSVASVREDSGRVIARNIMPTEPPVLVDFCRGMRGAVHVAFEEGTQAQWLHDMTCSRRSCTGCSWGIGAGRRRRATSAISSMRTSCRSSCDAARSAPSTTAVRTGRP
jgi:hypothetical protein